MLSADASGVFIIAATPFGDDGALDLAGLDQLVDWYGRAARNLAGRRSRPWLLPRSNQAPRRNFPGSFRTFRSRVGHR